MWDFKLGQVIGMMRKTMPFLLYRLGIYMAITLGYVLVTGGGAGIGWVAGKIGGDSATGASYGGLIGFGAASAALYFLREYILYIVKAGHIAVLIELLDGKSLPEGKGQVEYARDEVKSRFAESSVLFGVDQLIKGILKAFNRLMLGVANFIPIPGLQNLVKAASAVINMSLTYIDEVILAYYMKTNSDNPWKSAQRALVLYAQNYKVMLKNAVFLTFFIWLLTLLVFLLVLGPVFVIIQILPEMAGFWTFLFTALLAFGIKAAVIDPIAMTALMQVFFKTIEGQEPNPEWEAKLDKTSKKFRELKDKAADWRPGGSDDKGSSDLPPQGPPPAPPG